MYKKTSILATALVSMLAAGSALAIDPPQKKPAANGESAQPASDTWITTKVKASLIADSDVSGAKIEVDTVNSVVYLTGTVQTPAQADQAKRIASAIEGVSKVDVSRLKVTGA